MVVIVVVGDDDAGLLLDDAVKALATIIMKTTASFDKFRQRQLAIDHCFAVNSSDTATTERLQHLTVIQFTFIAFNV